MGGIRSLASGEATTSTASATRVSAPQRKVKDPASEAGQAKVDFYQTDKWHDGYAAKNIYIAPKNTLPPELSKRFLPSTKPDPVTDTTTYDRSLFGIDEYPFFTDAEKGMGGAQIRSHQLASPIADVTFDTNTFVVRLLTSQKTAMFPFSADAFLKAVDTAKWTTELYCLPPEPESDSDDEIKKL